MWVSLVPCAQVRPPSGSQVDDWPPLVCRAAHALGLFRWAQPDTPPRTAVPQLLFLAALTLLYAMLSLAAAASANAAASAAAAAHRRRGASFDAAATSVRRRAPRGAGTPSLTAPLLSQEAAGGSMPAGPQASPPLLSPAPSHTLPPGTPAAGPGRPGAARQPAWVVSAEERALRQLYAAARALLSASAHPSTAAAALACLSVVQASPGYHCAAQAALHGMPVCPHAARVVVNVRAGHATARQCPSRV